MVTTEGLGRARTAVGVSIRHMIIRRHPAGEAVASAAEVTGLVDSGFASCNRLQLKFLV